MFATHRDPPSPSAICSCWLSFCSCSLWWRFLWCIEHRWQRRELVAAVATLSDDAREAITLRVVDELSYPEVAARLEISEQTARMRVSRGLRALGNVMDAQLIREAAQA